MSGGDTARRNRETWDRAADEYQRKHGPQLDGKERAWGVWALPEDRLQVLGEVAGKDILELGCGAAQWSLFLAGKGARMVALDNSARQLHHARLRQQARGVEFPLVHASADAVPLADASFDVVFCDHGGMTFADPYRTVPEAARLLRPGGLLAFNMSSPLHTICHNPVSGEVDPGLHADYFALRRSEEDGYVEFQLPYGAWIRLFRRCGLVVEDLVELQAPADAEATTYDDYVSPRWARRWPAENIWKVRRPL